MSINYYWYRSSAEPHCPSCDCFQGMHIGMSSIGWAFALRIYPEKDIRELDDWVERFNAENAEIRDEYGDLVTTEEMLEVITERDVSASSRAEYGLDVQEGKLPTYELCNFEFS